MNIQLSELNQENEVCRSADPAAIEAVRTAS